MATLLVICFGIINDGVLYAGCHYGRADHVNTYRFNPAGQSASLDSQSRHGHARDFRFLGEWIYEAGEIKYVPWQSSSPCQGPNCRVNKEDDQPKTNVPPPRVARPLPLDFVVAQLNRNDSLILLGRISNLDLCGSAGYPHEHEYPP